MVQTMNEKIEKIISYLKSEQIKYSFNEDKHVLNIVIGVTNSGKEIVEQIYDYENKSIFLICISMKFGDDINLSDKNLNYRLLEYLHRANNGMLRGSFEYDIDNKIIRFKHYFEKSSISSKKYTMYNIGLPVIMFKKYFKGIDEIIKTEKSPKSIIKKIEKEQDT